MPKVTQQKPLIKPIRKLSASSSVLDRISDIDFDEDEGISLMLYGKSGTGKTTISATFPGPILWVIISGGTKPGELRSVNTPENRKKIKKVILQSSGELKEIIESQAADESWKTIVIDHVTGLADLVLKEIIYPDGGKEIPAQKSWGMASQQQYGQCTAQCKEYLRAFLSLSCNRIVIGQERESNTEGDSELLTPSVGVALTPSLAGWLNPAVDYIGQTLIRAKYEEVTRKVGTKEIVSREKVKGVEYCLRIAPHEVYVVKFRVPGGVKEEFIVDPTYEKIMAIINGG
jgi:hypothetical protein